MLLNSKLTGNVSKLQFHVKEQSCSYSSQPLLLSFLIWRTKRFYLFQPHSFQASATTDKTEEKKVMPKKYSCFFKFTCKSPLSLLQHLLESSCSNIPLLCCSSRCRSLLLLESKMKSSLWLHRLYLHATTFATTHYPVLSAQTPCSSAVWVHCCCMSGQSWL